MSSRPQGGSRDSVVIAQDSLIGRCRVQVPGRGYGMALGGAGGLATPARKPPPRSAGVRRTLGVFCPQFSLPSPPLRKALAPTG